MQAGLKVRRYDLPFAANLYEGPVWAVRVGLPCIAAWTL